MRTKFRLMGAGDCAEDCAIPMFCTPCALVQQAVEMEVRERLEL